MKTIDAKKLHAFGVEFLKAYGASQENAVIITDHLVDNDLKGIAVSYTHLIISAKVNLFEHSRKPGKAYPKSTGIRIWICPARLQYLQTQEEYRQDLVLLLFATTLQFLHGLGALPHRYSTSIQN